MIQNPWRGLASYREPMPDDIYRYKFCGRSAATRDLTRLIDNKLFVTLYGRTGVGKTSLLEAGIFPELRTRGYLPFSVRLGLCDMMEVSCFAEYIVKLLEREIPDIRTTTDAEIVPFSDGRLNADYLWEYFATRRFYVEDREVYPVIVLDQFEENLINRRKEARVLLQQLYSLIDDNKLFPEGYHSDTIFRVVVSIREDDLYRLEDCIDDLHLTDFKFNRYRLVQLSESEAHEVVAVPGAGLLPEDEEVKEKVISGIIKLVKEGNDGNINTLSLSLVCSVLFEKMIRSGRSVIGLEDIYELGPNPLTDFYLSVSDRLPGDAVEFIENRLVDSEGRRNAVTEKEIGDHFREWKEFLNGPGRILQRANGKVEVVHDMLAKAIYEVKLGREKKKKSRTLQVSVVIGTVLMLVCAAFSTVYDISGEDDRRLPVFRKKIVEVKDTTYFGGNKTVEEIRVSDTRSIEIEDCPALRKIVVENSLDEIHVDNCPELRYVDFQCDTVLSMGFFQTRRLHKLYIPGYVERISGSYSVEEIVPADTSRYLVMDGVLWEKRDGIPENVIFSRTSKGAFPYVKRSLESERASDGSSVSNGGIWLDNILFDEDTTRIIASRSPQPRILDLRKYPNLQRIDNYAFAGRQEINKVILPSAILNEPFRVFDGCESLDTVVVSGFYPIDRFYDMFNGNMGLTFVPAENAYVKEGGIIKYPEGTMSPYALSSEYAEDYYLDTSRNEQFVFLTTGYRVDYGHVYGSVPDAGCFKPLFDNGLAREATFRGTSVIAVYPFGPSYQYVACPSGKDRLYLDLYHVRYRRAIIDCAGITPEMKRVYVNNSCSFINVGQGVLENAVLYVPYGRLEDYIADFHYNCFREVRESSLAATIWNNVLSTVDGMTGFFRGEFILIGLCILGVLAVGAFFFILSRSRLESKMKHVRHKILRSLATSVMMMLFLVVSWVGVYWFVWYVIVMKVWVCALVACIISVAIVFALYYNVLFELKNIDWNGVWQSCMGVAGWLKRHSCMIFKVMLSVIVVGVVVYSVRSFVQSQQRRLNYSEHVYEVASSEDLNVFDAYRIIKDYKDNSKGSNFIFKEEADSVETRIDSLKTVVTSRVADEFSEAFLIGLNGIGSIYNLDVSCDGRYLLAGGDHGIAVVDMEDYSITDSIVFEEGLHVRDVSADSDFSRIMYSVAGSGGFTRIHSVSDGKISRVEVTEIDEDGYLAELSGDGLSMAMSVWRIRVFDPLSGEFVAELRGGHNGQVMDFCYGEESNFLYSCGSDGSVIRWSVAESSISSTELFCAEELLSSIDVDEKIGKVVASGLGGTYLYDLNTGSLTVIPCSGRKVSKYDECGFFNEGKNIFRQVSSGIELYDVASGSSLHGVLGYVSMSTFLKDNLKSVAEDFLYGGGPASIKIFNLSDDPEKVKGFINRAFEYDMRIQPLTVEERDKYGLK